MDEARPVGVALDLPTVSLRHFCRCWLEWRARGVSPRSPGRDTLRETEVLPCLIILRLCPCRSLSRFRNPNQACHRSLSHRCLVPVIRCRTGTQAGLVPAIWVPRPVNPRPDRICRRNILGQAVPMKMCHHDRVFRWRNRWLLHLDRRIRHRARLSRPYGTREACRG